MGAYIKINVCATQGLTGDDGNVIDHFDQDNVNTALSHTAAYQYDVMHRLTTRRAISPATQRTRTNTTPKEG